MYRILLTLVFTCVYVNAYTQVNYVKNPSFEDTVKCPDEINEIGRAKYWNCAVDTAGNIDGLQYYAPEYYNACSGTAMPVRCAVPDNAFSYQYPRTGNAYIGAGLYYDKTPPPPAGATANWRDYAQGHLIKALTAGKTYCVSFWVVLAETSGYAHDHIGVYLDNGNINKRSPAGIEITDVLPQVFSTSIIKDTMNWIKVEGSFVAAGNETHITLGNFAKQADVYAIVVPYYAFLEQNSCYLIDDVSVIPIDLDVQAGADTWVEQGSKRKIGRVGDTTTLGLDCKWYHKGVLIDSGAIISVNANAVKGVVDTYVVVQTICGLVKSDTVLVTTVGLGAQEFEFENRFTVYPNPTDGVLNIHSDRQVNGNISATIFDLLGKRVCHCILSFADQQASLRLALPDGSYILELRDESGTLKRERVVLAR